MNIIVIGFMGAGKSVVGQLLAQKLNMEFIDMDIEIEKREKCSIPKIFEKSGENYFRELEKNLLIELCQKNNYIISTGGGIVTLEENREILQKQSKVVFLDASAETIINHVSKEIHKRPLLKESTNLLQKVQELLSKRYNYYKECSNITIDINKKNIDEVVSQILVYIR